MSEKRFKRGDNLSCVDTGTGESYWYACNLCGLLNRQQATIEEQNKEIEEWEFSFRTEMAHHRVAEKELQEKIREQQSTIDKQELRLQRLEEILELSENLNKSYREKLIDMNLKMRIGDE